MIDILMSTFNGEKYIREQIDSIFSQTIQKFNLIIRDDGSTDNTINIINEYQEKHSNIFLYQDGINKGACLSFLSLLNYSLSEYVMFCDQDDVWKPNKIETLINFISRLESDKKNKPLLVFSDMEVVNESLEVINLSFMKMSKNNPSDIAFTQLLPSNRVPGCTCIFNRKLVDIVKTNREGILMHDYWIALIASCFGEIYYLDEKLNLYRQHSNNVVGIRKYSIIERNSLIIELIKSSVINKKSHFDKSREQAKVFLNLYEEDLSDIEKKEIDFFIHEKEYSVIKRIILLKKYGFLIGSFGYKVALILF